MQIRNVGFPIDSTNLISVKDARENNVIFHELNLINDTFYINNLDTGLMEIKNGMPLLISSLSENTGTVTIAINNTFYPVVKNNLQPLSTRDVAINKMCIFILHENKFILMNEDFTSCPPGFAQPNESYCIEQNERTGTFWNAVSTCNNLGYRLCSWSEWYFACQKVGLGMVGRTNNWEWVNSAQNEPSQGKGVGNGGCTKNVHRVLTTNDFFRCCKSR
jgi:hypothetical protein